jgi:ribosomal protein S8
MLFKIFSKKCLIIGLVLLTQFAYSQTGGQNNMAARILNADYLNKTGDALSDVKGSPFLQDSWQKVYLYLNGGGKVFVEKMKLNGYTGEVHYIDDKGAELATLEGSITTIDLLNPKDTTQVIRTYQAFADPNKKNQILFYELHNKGAFQIVSRLEKFIFTENYDPLKGKTEQYFKVNTVYGIATKGILSPIAEISYASVTNAHPALLQKAASAKKIKLRSINDVVLFLKELN